MPSWEIPALDEALGGLREHSFVLVHEADPRARGKEILFHILREKLKQGHLVGYFNISYPIHVLMKAFDVSGIDARKYLDKGNLAIIDTFGSFYDIASNIKGIWYLKGSLSADVLPAKYVEVVEAHKKRWAEQGMFEGRELYGFTMDVSDYIDMLGGELETLRYLEISAELRVNARAYRDYPKGTNFWLWGRKGSPAVMASVYRRASYVLRVKSEFNDGNVVRYLEVLKAPEMGNEVIRFRYHFDDRVPVLERI
ncbi:hypothetical protein [Thermococcus sp. 21S9]|uniref:hypothetical protein n=1 Tax=Thermococcus sp. 21S9 TaxID=1638223 RepID=UPI00143C2725|nr:hypothetical protein [Thermococcus sp. 21S9]NJE54074.1 hypothetical protein [Thermococcus sp. 21S9]